jgi:hypothetical protein
MIFQMCPARALPIVAALLWLTPVASAQDAMELDLAFKNSLSRGPASEIQDKRSIVQGRRHETGDARGVIAKARRRGHGRWAEAH